MSELPKNETKIGDLTVRTTQFSCMRALPMWTRLSNILAPAFRCLETLDAKSMAVLKHAVDNEDLTPEHMVKLLPALAPFLETLDADAVTRIARELLSSTVVVKTGPDGKRVKIELQGRDEKITAAFGKDLMALLRALWFVGKVNFRGFSSAASASGDESPTEAESST